MWYNNIKVTVHHRHFYDIKKSFDDVFYSLTCVLDTYF